MLSPLAWSTLRKRANDRGFYARQVMVDANRTPVYMLFDEQMNVKMATRNRIKLQEAVCSL